MAQKLALRPDKKIRSQKTCRTIAENLEQGAALKAFVKHDFRSEDSIEPDIDALPSSSGIIVLDESLTTNHFFELNDSEDDLPIRVVTWIENNGFLVVDCFAQPYEGPAQIDDDGFETIDLIRSWLPVCLHTEMRLDGRRLEPSEQRIVQALLEILSAFEKNETTVIPL